MMDKIERMMYRRKIERLQKANRELTRMVDSLNRQLADSETNIEYLTEVLSREKDGE